MLVRLLAYSGVRIGEALALRWSAVDLDRKVMTIRESVEDHSGTIWVGPTKTYATRTVTLPNALVDQMRMRSSTGLVFPNRKGGYLRYGNWRRDVWDPAAKAAGLEVLPHDLRGTCASLLIDAGASVKDVNSTSAIETRRRRLISTPACGPDVASILPTGLMRS